MQNELKSAIRFNDFVAYFGARGVLVLAWWMGAAHAARIREDQHSFPFLQINGAAGSGKSLLLEYLQKLNGHSHRGHSLANATQAGRARIYANADRPIVICESYDGSADHSFDWDELKPLYNSCPVTFKSGEDQFQTETFKGALVITANQPVECSDALSSRMIMVDLSAKDAQPTRIRPDAVAEVDLAQASAFGLEVKEREAWISNNIRYYGPAYQKELLEKYGSALNARTALNCSQMLVLIDLLCNLLSIDDALRMETRKLVHDIAFLDTIPY
ncbi:hypothetical protein [Pseudomonas marginalis]|uniref:hypothetical protein n=1 Tax=Pseudomonas marginalis TaxID=298 RepID=UPI0034D589F0